MRGWDAFIGSTLIRHVLAEPSYRVVNLETSTNAGTTRVIDRPGHDHRSANDAAETAGELGWTPSVTFKNRLAETSVCELANEAWWTPRHQRFDRLCLGQGTS